MINDARAGDVGRDMVPDLRKSDYGAAALVGAIGVSQFIAADAGVQLTGIPQRAARPPTKDAPWWLPFLIIGGIFLIIRALSRAGRSGRGPRGGGGLGNAMGRGGSWGGGFGGSSGGWGGGGGGGFGGFGGGMSGGGGAGGSW